MIKKIKQSNKINKHANIEKPIPQESFQRVHSFRAANKKENAARNMT